MNKIYYPRNISSNLKSHFTRQLNKETIFADYELQTFRTSNSSSKIYHTYTLTFQVEENEEDLIITIEKITQNAYTDYVGLKHQEQAVYPI